MKYMNVGFSDQQHKLLEMVAKKRKTYKADILRQLVDTLPDYTLVEEVPPKMDLTAFVESDRLRAKLMADEHITAKDVAEETDPYKMASLLDKLFRRKA